MVGRVLTGFGVVALGVVALGCGRLGFDNAAGDTRSDTGPASDAIVFADGVIAPACPGSTVLLDDEFDTTGAAPLFMAYTEASLTLAEAGGALSVTFDPSVPDGSYAGYRSILAPPPEGLCASVAVTAVPSENGAAYLKLWTMDEAVEILVYGGYLSFRTHLDRDETTVFFIPFDLAVHAFWRIRQVGGETFFETSSDGVVYTAHVSTTYLTVPTVRFELGAGSFGASEGAGVAVFNRALLLGP